MIMRTELQNVTFYYWVIQLNSSSALLGFIPVSDVSRSIGTVASQVFLSDQLCPVAFIIQILKAGNVSYQLYPLLLYSESCIRWWPTQTRMKTRELTLREKQAIWMLKENKSIRALAKTRTWRNQEFGNHQQPTTTWSAEKTTVVDDRQTIKAVKQTRL